MQEGYWCVDTSCVLLFGGCISLVAIFLSSVFVLFPFYVMSFRSNRERDDEVANSTVFLILRHFYHMVITMELCYLINVVTLIAMLIGFLTDMLYFAFLAAFFALVSLTFTITVTMMENLLLSVLTIYRFFLYFFPRSEHFLTISLSFSRGIVIILYIIIFFSNFFLRLAKIFLAYETRIALESDSWDFDGATPDIEFYDTILQSVYIFLTIFQVLSAFLYFPMACSVRKMGNLQSAKNSQPEKYILYQACFLVVFRLLYIPAIMYLYVSHPDSSNRTIIWDGMQLVDLCITHFIIQASYLSCNKKHMELLLRFCGSKKIAVVDMYTKHMDTSTIATN